MGNVLSIVLIACPFYSNLLINFGRIRLLPGDHGFIIVTIINLPVLFHVIIVNKTLDPSVNYGQGSVKV